MKNLPAMQFDSWVGKIPWRRDRLPTPVFLGFPCGSAGKESACSAGDLAAVPGLGRFLQKGKATHSSILAWRIPWTVKSMESTKSRTGLSDFHFHFGVVSQEREDYPRLTLGEAWTMSMRLTFPLTWQDLAHLCIWFRMTKKRTNCCPNTEFWLILYRFASVNAALNMLKIWPRMVLRTCSNCSELVQFILQISFSLSSDLRYFIYFISEC